MTMPASLPMTTDYFPEKRSLEFDYVISDYSVVPESVHTCQSKYVFLVASIYYASTVACGKLYINKKKL